MKNWQPTVAGLLTAIGLGLQSMDDPTFKAIGTVVAAIGAALLGWSAKQHNVHGGTVPQATPPSVEASSRIMGIEEIK